MTHLLTHFNRLTSIKLSVCMTNQGCCESCWWLGTLCNTQCLLRRECIVYEYFSLLYWAAYVKQCSSPRILSRKHPHLFGICSYLDFLLQSMFACIYTHACAGWLGYRNHVRDNIRGACWKHFKGVFCSLGVRRRQLITTEISHSLSLISHFLITDRQYRQAATENKSDESSVLPVCAAPPARPPSRTSVTEAQLSLKALKLIW